MKIYDCFIFYNELTLLELRLRELYDYVDHFVLVEATKTHRGEDKPLYYQENRKRFKEWEDKIIHIVVDDMPKVGFSYGKNWKINSILKGGPWKLESYQKRQIPIGLKDCEEGDIIMISDLDEIPNVKKFPEMIDKLEKEKIVFFNTKLYYYFLNGFANKTWIGTRVCKFKTLKRMFNLNINRFRHLWNIKLRIKMYFGKKIYMIENGGWHFSYLGNIQNIIKKISSSCHFEKDIPENKVPEEIKEKIERGEFLYGEKITYIPIDEGFPKTIQDNVDKYLRYIKEVDDKNEKT